MDKLGIWLGIGSANLIGKKTKQLEDIVVNVLAPIVRGDSRYAQGMIILPDGKEVFIIAKTRKRTRGTATALKAKQAVTA